MAVKTTATNERVSDFILAFTQSEQRKTDAFYLLDFFESITGHPGVMWGPSIIGFGTYRLTTAADKKGNDWPIVAYSPRKAAISLYVYVDTEEHRQLLSQLGKFTMGKSCIYIKKVSDIELKVLEKLILASIKYVENNYG